MQSPVNYTRIDDDQDEVPFDDQDGEDVEEVLFDDRDDEDLEGALRARIASSFRLPSGSAMTTSAVNLEEGGGYWEVSGIDRGDDGGLRYAIAAQSRLDGTQLS